MPPIGQYPAYDALPPMRARWRSPLGAVPKARQEFDSRRPNPPRCGGQIPIPYKLGAEANALINRLRRAVVERLQHQLFQTQLAGNNQQIEQQGAGNPLPTIGGKRADIVDTAQSSL